MMRANFDYKTWRGGQSRRCNTCSFDLSRRHKSLPASEHHLICTAPWGVVREEGLRRSVICPYQYRLQVTHAFGAGTVACIGAHDLPASLKRRDPECP